MPNRLKDATSPYLQQHAHNPVDWNPWDAQALDRARREDRPIFLSIGYSACHWCHVMERESFEDPRVAAYLNDHFVPIKVDREERPDLDDLYMGAVQAITGAGGWPMSVWLTPDLKPFFGGTYFPPLPRQGLPGFLSLLEGIHEAWQTRRADLEAGAGHLLAALDQDPAPGESLPGLDCIPAALEALARTFDPRWGGFGPAPKFPQPCGLETLLRLGGPADRDRALRTLDAMAQGGIHDHLGGGFARYSVDAQWHVPHFEKMLYDNAQLAALYLEAYRRTGQATYREVARGTLDYLLRDLADPAGGFCASEDADSEGREGAFYVFTPAQVEAALGPADGARFCRANGVTPAGDLEGGASVLHRTGDPVEPALRERLRRFREERPRPARDGKVLAGWNGLALSALARAGALLEEPRYLEAARALATFLARDLTRDEGLLRVWREGRAHTPAFLEDYAAVILGLVDLYEAVFDPAWLRRAFVLGEELLARFQDPAGGCFASEPKDDLLLRHKPLQDGALPSGNSLAARALLALDAQGGSPSFREGAEGILRAAAPLLSAYPAAGLGLLPAVAACHHGPTTLVVAGPPDDPGTQALVRAARQFLPPGSALSLVEADPALPLHAGRRSASPQAFLCADATCAAPAATAEELCGRFKDLGIV
jgi:uncharacterized protein